MVTSSKDTHLDSTPEEEQYGTYVGRLARGAGLSFAGQGGGRILNYATQIALAWMYGPAQLGLYALGITLIQMTNILSQCGMDNGVVRYVAYYRTEKDTARMRGIVIMALGVPLVLSLLITACIFFGAGFLANVIYHKPALGMVFRVFSLSLPLLTLMNMALYASVGFQTVRYLTYVQQILQPLVNFALILVFYFMGAHILGAVTAYIISMLVGALLALYYLKRIFPKLLDGSNPAKYEMRKLFNHSWPLTFSNFTQRTNTWTAVMVLGIFGSASEVGIYNAASRTAMLSALVLFAFNGIFSPIIASLYRKGLLKELNSLYQDVSRWVFTGGLVIFLISAALGRDILAVLGPKFVSGWTVLVVISAAQLFNSSVGPTQRMLAMTRHQKILMMSTVGSAILGVITSFALTPTFGALGAAVATGSAIVIGNAAMLLAVRKKLGFWPYDGRYAKPAVAGVLATAVVLLLQMTVPFLSSGVLALLVLTGLFLVVFVLLLLLMGLDASDRQLIASLIAPVRRVLHRRARPSSGV